MRPGLVLILEEIQALCPPGRAPGQCDALAFSRASTRRGASRLQRLIHRPFRPSMAKASWFGAAVSRATHHAADLPRPFPDALAQVVQKHVGKAEAARRAALQAIREVSSGYEEVMKSFCAMELEGLSSSHGHSSAACQSMSWRSSKGLKVQKAHEVHGLRLGWMETHMIHGDPRLVVYVVL